MYVCTYACLPARMYERMQTLAHCLAAARVETGGRAAQEVAAVHAEAAWRSRMKETEIGSNSSADPHGLPRSSPFSSFHWRIRTYKGTGLFHRILSGKVPSGVHIFVLLVFGGKCSKSGKYVLRLYLGWVVICCSWWNETLVRICFFFWTAILTVKTTWQLSIWRSIRLSS